jgi:hypothetical protein
MITPKNRSREKNFEFFKEHPEPEKFSGGDRWTKSNTQLLCWNGNNCRLLSTLGNETISKEDNKPYGGSSIIRTASPVRITKSI